MSTVKSWHSHITDKHAFELFGDGKAATSTRDKLLDTALDLFYTNGIHAVGIDQIISEVGVTKTTFYNHFESKDQLILDALARRGEWESKAFMARLFELVGDNPKKMLLAVFDVFDEWFTEPDYRGCQFLSACMEFPSPSDPIHQIGAQHEINVCMMIADTARKAGAKDPDALAEQITMLLNGALMHRLVRCDKKAASKARVAAAELIEKQIT